MHFESRSDIIFVHHLTKFVDVRTLSYFAVANWCADNVGDELDVYWKMGGWVVGNPDGKWDTMEYEDATRFFFHKDTPDALLIECKLLFG